MPPPPLAAPAAASAEPTAATAASVSSGSSGLGLGGFNPLATLEGNPYFSAGFGRAIVGKVAQPSASWLSGGLFQRQIMPQAAQFPGASASLGQPRPASANQPLGPRWPAIPALFGCP